MPLGALASLLELGDTVRRDLPFVTTPTLVAHARQDHTVPFDDALEIAGSLGSDVVERVWLERSYHLVGIDVERRELGAALARFFTKQLGAASVAASAPQASSSA
jgi:carboxylesterase